jgi:hypothetical protein
MSQSYWLIERDDRGCHEWAHWDGTHLSWVTDATQATAYQSLLEAHHSDTMHRAFQEAAGISLAVTEHRNV